MATNGVQNGTTHRFDPHFTDNVINATGPKASPRVQKVFAGLIRHLHDFCREEEVTMSELMAAINFVRGSQLSTPGLS
jgi:catechol 1,2-dioxygenase